MIQGCAYSLMVVSSVPSNGTVPSTTPGAWFPHNEIVTTTADGPAILPQYAAGVRDGVIITDGPLEFEGGREVPPDIRSRPLIYIPYSGMAGEGDTVIRTADGDRRVLDAAPLLPLPASLTDRLRLASGVGSGPQEDSTFKRTWESSARRLIPPWAPSVDEIMKQITGHSSLGWLGSASELLTGLAKLSHVVHAFGCIPGVRLQVAEQGFRLSIDRALVNAALNSDTSLPFIDGAALLYRLAATGRLVVLPSGAIELSSTQFLGVVRSNIQIPFPLAHLRTAANPHGAFTPGQVQYFSWGRPISREPVLALIGGQIDAGELSSSMETQSGIGRTQQGGFVTRPEEQGRLNIATTFQALHSSS